MEIAFSALVALTILVLAILWRLKPTNFKLTLKLWRLLHLEVESESRRSPSEN